MDDEVKQRFLMMYRIIRGQQELIGSQDVKIRALEMVLSTREGFQAVHDEAVKALSASEVVRGHEAALVLIDLEIQSMGGERAPDPPSQA